MLLYMIRHGRTDWNRDRMIMGREPVPLNDDGRAMVRDLAGFLAGQKIGTIYSGTLVRTMETSRILAEAWGAAIVPEPLLDESAYEKWVGMRYSDLAGDEDFRLYNTFPTRSRFSLGEGMKEIQERALEAAARIERRSAPGRAAMVSHSDVIKPVIAHVLGMDLDRMHSLGVANASVTLLDTNGPAGPRIRYMNLMPWKWGRGCVDTEGERWEKFTSE
ncbi:MAG: histidine phosphatase family protein [Candidatus Krumholzibacteria bacterium]|nr:histidine phosphatase family protein [Candidatus Krumholzibacteria bacterium]